MRKGVIYPPASNDSNSRYAYYGRLQYEPIISSFMSETALKRHMDLIFERPLYGKVNDFGQIIDLNVEGNMSPVSSKNNVFCLDFVADAFQEFQDIFENYATTNGGIDLPTKMFKIDANSGYQSASQAYKRHSKEVRDFFIEFHLEPIKNKIKTINDIATELLKFVRIFSSQETFTYSSFLLSSKCSHFMTGLSLDIMDHDYGDDTIKNDIMSSQDYEAYSRIAAKAGFKLNINAPWNLIANLSSRTMKRHMSSYGVESITQFFKEYYVESYAMDLSKLKQFIIHTFYQFSEDYPDIIEKEFCRDGTLKRLLITKRPVSDNIETLNEQLNLNLLLDIYISCRYNELVTIKLLDSQFDDIREKAMYRLANFGELSAFKYVDNSFTNLNPKIVKLKQDSGSTAQNIIGSAGETTTQEQLDEPDTGTNFQPTSNQDYGPGTAFPGPDGVDGAGY